MSEALVSRGNDLFVDELFTEALDCYDAALNLAADGRAAGAIHAKRSATFLKLCRVEEALSAAELALSADPESGIAFKQCGLAMWQLGRKAEARGKFIEAKNLGVQGMEKWISQCPTIEQYEKETKKEEVLEDSVKSTLADKMKFAWIQTTSTVTLTFYAKNLKPDSFKVRIETTKVEVEILLADESKYRREFLLFGNVDPDASSYTTNAFKLIITLKKEQALEWDDIIKEAQDTSVKKRTNVLGNSAPEYPSSSQKKLNWSDLEKEEQKASEEDGDPLTKLFQDIYSKADEDTRRAMIKSFQTSGGTVLSTNWEEVKAKNYEKEISAPKGMEVRKWEA